MKTKLSSIDLTDIRMGLRRAKTEVGRANDFAADVEEAGSPNGSCWIVIDELNKLERAIDDALANIATVRNEVLEMENPK